MHDCFHVGPIALLPLIYPRAAACDQSRSRLLEAQLQRAWVTVPPNRVNIIHYTLDSKLQRI